MPTGVGRMGKAPLMVRTYETVHHANAGKVAAVRAILPVWQQACGVYQRVHVANFFNGILPWSMNPGTHDLAGELGLSERQKRSVQNQVVAGVSAWIGAQVESIQNHIWHSNLDRRIKLELSAVASSKRFHGPADAITVPVYVTDETTGRTVTVKDPDQDNKALLRAATEAECAMVRAIAKHVRARHARQGDLSRARTMLMDGPIAQVEAPEHSTGVDYWARISTLSAGEVVRIPLVGTDYMNSRPGELSNFVQVVVRYDEVRFNLVATNPTAPARTDGKTVGLDWGINTLIATSEGDLLGRGFHDQLRRYDLELQRLAVAIQKAGQKLNDSAAYRRLNQRISDYVTNETNRCLNRVMALHDPATLVVEKLDFRGSGMSRRMNRILTRAGRGAVDRKLQALHEEFGVTIIEVHAAYSSQTCSGCGYCDNRNRNGDKFVCRFCGRRSHADINGSKVVGGRSAQQSHWHPRVGRATISKRVDLEFTKRWKTNPVARRELGRRPVSAKQSAAVQIVASGQPTHHSGVKATPANDLVAA